MESLELLKSYIDGKKLLIVGGAPSASKKSKEWYDSFDIIVRCNNYKKINSSRTDIFFSYFGRNIKKSKEELIADGVKFLINKCPNSDMSDVIKNYTITMADYRWIYDLRKDWWFCPLISLTEEELLSQIDLLGGFMPTVGLSAILFFKQFNCKINIIGFDCFKSGIHNLDEKWDNSGNHAMVKEEMILTYLSNQKDIIWHR